MSSDAKASKVQVEVTYCGGWGYRPKYEAIKGEIEKNCGTTAVEITGVATKEVSGWLEVQIKGGKLLHSKKNGDGYVNTKEKMDKIIGGVNDAIKAQAK